MTAPDDRTEHPPSDTPPAGSNAERPVRRRVDDAWHRIEPVATKAGAVVLSVAAAAVVKGLIARSSTHTPAPAPEKPADPPTAMWTNHAGGYYTCSHGGCQKKVNPTIFGHGCCGRCFPGRNCLSAAQRDYDGPGHVAHNYHDGPLYPGVCTICSQPSEAHLWHFDRIHGERRAR